MTMIKQVGIQLGCVVWLIFSGAACAGFSLSTSSDFYTVDTGAGVVFKVRRNDHGSSTQSVGDIASLQINGQEFQNQSRGSHVNAGFDWLYQGTSQVNVSATMIDKQYIKVAVTAGSLTHYYLARKGYPHIYMATYFTKEPDVHGHVRYILRLNRTLLPNGPTPSDVSKQVRTVEAGDIFALSNGHTRSKHYSNQRAIDWTTIGATGKNVGVWIVKDSQEGSSGGPFYRSLLNQGTASNQEITYIVNYGQAQTEAFRTHVLNQYTLVATGGSRPSASIDTSWFSDMGLKGYVPASGRGKVSGVGLKNTDGTSTYTIGFANANAQYWTKAYGSQYQYQRSDMLPGTYRLTVYRNELAVATTNVTVKKGQTTALHSIQIQDDPNQDAAIWRIGTWDGSPQEFLNGAHLTTMHPSDVRLADWDATNFIVGTSKTNGFPAYIWRKVNQGYVVYFKLSEAQRQKAHTIRFGITTAYAGGRPQLHINQWTSKVPAASSQPKTRNMTTGSYRGNNTTFTYTVPASAWAASGQWNTMVIQVASGSSGEQYLSPGFSVDAIDLVN